MPPLRPGIGAKGSILTRFIKPKQVAVNEDANHRSNIVIRGWYSNNKGTVYYEFLCDNGDTALQYGAARMVKIHEEGTPTEFFIGQAPQRAEKAKEPKVKWNKSTARKLLYEDIRTGLVTKEMTKEEIYTMRPEYAAYDWENFASRLEYLFKSVSLNSNRAAADLAAFDDFVANNPVSYYNSMGYIQWQGSDAQQHAQQDIKDKAFDGKGKYRRLYNSRPEYYMEFPFENFKHRIRQELRSAKHKHTIDVRGKTYGNPKNWPGGRKS